MRKAIYSALTFLLLSGCAIKPYISDFPGLENPNSDEAIIYYFGDINSIVKENGEPICTLTGYYPHHTHPGDKHIETAKKSTSELYLSVEKGKRYFVYGDSFSWGDGLLLMLATLQPKLVELDEETALLQLNKRHYKRVEKINTKQGIK